ncbi:MAG: hypothetical protein KDC90_18295, partial [Ignavibacteriae bacterium]|nr:hypothetical protein [Ignavibacteriota bacterium]
FAKLGKVYAIYLPKSEPGKNGRIDLSALQGKLTLKWYNPRKGAFEGTPIEVEKTSEYTITSPPSEKDDDWVILISDGVFNQNYYYDDRPVPVTITSSPSVGKYYIAKNNILVVDFESHDSVLGWKMSSDHEGYTSDGYLLWQGGNHYDDSSWGNMEFNFMISTEGNYKLNIHNYHEGPDASEKNDVWVKMDNGVWNKVFSSEADKWNWSTNFDLGDSKPAASFDLSKGMHTIYFAGRSQGFGADRFHLYIDGYESALDLKIPNSQLVKSEVTPTLTEENTPSTVATVWPTFKKDPDSVMCGAADINGDNVIDLKDFKGFKDVYNKTCLDYPEPTGCGGKDFVYDGVINIKDFSEWSKLYGEPCE